MYSGFYLSMLLCTIVKKKQKAPNADYGRLALWVCHNIMGQYRDKGIKCPYAHISLADGNTL
jgi:hypothetical protein